MNANNVQGSKATFWRAKAEVRTQPVQAFRSGHKAAKFLRLLRSRLVHIFAVSIATSSSDLLSTYTLTEEGFDFGFWLLAIIASRLVAVFGVVVALTAAQVWIPKRRFRMIAMALAVLLICASTAALHASGWDAGLTKLHGEAWAESGWPLFLYLFWMNSVVTSLLAIVYERQMRANRVLMAVRSTWLADEAIERQNLESRLNSAKARVDPEFLFAAIGRCEVLYRQDIDTAEKLLDQLIEFLRASVPQSNQAPSTLEKEMALCGGYLRIEGQLRKEALNVQMTCNAADQDGPFPTSVLLLLVQALLPPRGAVDPFALSMGAEKLLLCKRIELHCTAAAPPPPALALDSAAAMLQSFFGPYARVILLPGSPVGNTILIEVPNERA